MTRGIKISALTVVIAAIFWGAGFAGFVQDIAASPDLVMPEAGFDGIVVLTGDRGRIDGGLRALAAGGEIDGGGKRLLISGVNAELERETILKAIGSPSELAACCIDLGRAAFDTRGNAIEAAHWAEQHKLRSLLVVTSDYHMPRTLVEFERALPDAKLLPMPVATDPGIIAIALEYSKYLLSLARLELTSP